MARHDDAASFFSQGMWKGIAIGKRIVPHLAEIIKANHELNTNLFNRQPVEIRNTLLPSIATDCNTSPAVWRTANELKHFTKMR